MVAAVCHRVAFVEFRTIRASTPVDTVLAEVYTPFAVDRHASDHEDDHHRLRRVNNHRIAAITMIHSTGWTTRPNTATITTITMAIRMSTSTDFLYPDADTSNRRLFLDLSSPVFSTLIGPGQQDAARSAIHLGGPGARYCRQTVTPMLVCRGGGRRGHSDVGACAFQSGPPALAETWRRPRANKSGD